MKAIKSFMFVLRFSANCNLMFAFCIFLMRTESCLKYFFEKFMQCHANIKQIFIVIAATEDFVKAPDHESKKMLNAARKCKNKKGNNFIKK